MSERDDEENPDDGEDPEHPDAWAAPYDPDALAIEEDGDQEIIQCWCGERGTYDELFDDDGLEGGCGGTGFVDCYCGGDQCVCHHHGQEVECPGCDECPGDEDDYDYDEDQEDE